MEENEAVRDLVVRAQRGDRSALTELITRAAPTVAALVRAMVPRRAERDDIVQEVLVRAISHLKSVRDPARFGAYVNEITRNLVYDRSRRAHPTGELPEEVPSDRGGPVAEVERREDRVRVHHALRSLGELDRKIVLLRHWAELSYDEIASTLGITVSAVQSRLFRARQQLKGLL